MIIHRKPSQYCHIFIDSSAIDSIRERIDLNTFFERHHMIYQSPSIEAEINHNNTPETTKQPFKGQKWFTCDTPLSCTEEEVKNGIIKIMQGKANNKKHLNDALHIFSAAKHDGYLVAIDKRIIKNRDAISQYLYEQQFGTFKQTPFRFIYTPDEFIERSNYKTIKK